MKITGLKKAIGDYRCFNAGGRFSPEYGRLMYDKETGELWTDYFYSLGHNTWKEYRKSSIINLGRLIELEGQPVKMATVKAYIQEHFN